MRRILRLLLSYLPQPLPAGKTDMNQFIDEIVGLSGAFADRDSMAFAICSMIMHAGESRGYMSKQYFVRRLRKVAANQVAGQIFTDIKEAQQKRIEAEKLSAKPQPEATSETTNNETPQD
jgi:hypothetical protein